MYESDNLPAHHQATSTDAQVGNFSGYSLQCPFILPDIYDYLMI
jgi:hypothetical protein